MSTTYQSTYRNEPYSKTVEITDNNKVLGDNFPEGLSISNLGVISGTPTLEERKAITIFAINPGGVGFSVLDLSVQNHPKPIMEGFENVDCETLASFSYAIETVSDIAVTSYGAVNLPPGLNVNTSSGIISGTPSSSSETPQYYTTVYTTATNSTGTSGKDVLFSMKQRPAITSSLASLSYSLNASITPYTITANKSANVFSAENLPPGLSCNPSTGVISGSVTAPGYYNVILKADNGVLVGYASKIIEVTTAPIITSASSFSNYPTYNGLAKYQITASAYPAITSYGATGLPSQLSINTSTGYISGIPAVGSSTFTVSATNSLGTGTKSVTVTGVVAPPPPPPPPAPNIYSVVASSSTGFNRGKFYDFIDDEVTIPVADTKWTYDGRTAPLDRTPWIIYISWEHTNTSVAVTLNGAPISNSRLIDVGLHDSKYYIRDFGSGNGSLSLQSDWYWHPGFPRAYDYEYRYPAHPPAVMWPLYGNWDSTFYFPYGTYTVGITLVGTGGTTTRTFTLNLV